MLLFVGGLLNVRGCWAGDSEVCGDVILHGCLRGRGETCRASLTTSNLFLGMLFIFSWDWLGVGCYHRKR